jgi:signal transduction histidine kinase
MKMSAPLLIDRYPLGSITICSHLTETYQILRKSEKIVLIYIFLNTIILIMVGIYLLSRTVVNPIHKILKTTEAFREGEAFNLMTETSQNEIGQLSRSLNSMLKRLEENKEELRSHISSLESANQEIKEAQEKIIRSEKLASVGRLASGVAHEIGNPIGIILGYIELVKKGDLTDEEAQDSLNRVESELIRVSRIIRQLLDFSRPSGGEQKETKVHELVDETVNMLNPQPMMSNITIETNLSAANDCVWADPNQLQQVILNIIMNSADAMGESRDSGSQESENVLAIVSDNRGNNIELKFIDTGPGIPAEELTRIFDPFYTTKDPGKGTGLGLSVCNAIMEGLGGSINAESVLGKGTTIIMSMPLLRSQNPMSMAQDRGKSL